MKRSSKRHRREKKKASLMLEPPGQLRYVADVEPEVLPETEAPEQASDEPSLVESAVAKADALSLSPRWRRWGAVASLVGVVSLGLCLYAHTLNFPFQFDDHIYLLGSPFVTQAQDFLTGRTFHEVANHSVTLGLGYDPSVNFILRPVAYLSFHLNYLVNGFTPSGFRVVNIAIHCANAVLLFLLLSHFLRKSPKAAGLPGSSVLFIPLTASLLFVAHPLHTESVTYIVQRFTSMVGFFLLAATLLHFLSLSAKRRGAAIALRIAAVAAMIGGMLTKESMFTAPLLIVMLHIVVMEGTVKRALWQALPHLLCMLILPVLALLTSQAQSGSGSVAAAMQIAASSKDPAYQVHYFMTQLGVVLEYVRLILWPQGLNVDRQYNLATSFLQLRVWLSALVLVTIVVTAWRLYRKSSMSIRHVLIAAGIFWYFLRLAVSSSFVPLDDLMVDHRTYGASMGLLTVVACLLDLVRTEWPKLAGARWWAPAALAAWVAVLSAATLNRNDVWQSETSLWSDAVLKSPGKARPWDNLGVCHYLAGRQDEAIACLVKSVTINPHHLPAYMKLGVIYNARLQFADAREWAQKGLAIFPDSAPLHYNLGVALCGLGRVPEGKGSMEAAVKIMPTHVAAHAALGQIYRHLNNHKESLRHYKQAAALGATDAVIAAAISELEPLVGPQHAQN